MTKIAIIGASYLQLPLIIKAKEMGYETHVFAWEAGDVGETEADFFYPISIVEKDEILDKCRQIGIDGIVSIASDLASVTVNYVAMNMGLSGNTLSCTEVSTNKHRMRNCFKENGDPSVESHLVTGPKDLENLSIHYPVIVKPTDRSGSRAIAKVWNYKDLTDAVKNAIDVSFEKKALVEEFAEGDEYSVEFITYKGVHHFLAITKKYTTGAPHFIETGHIEPSGLDNEMIKRVKEVISHALTSLGVENSASHSEIKIDQAGQIRIIEIGARMGGDMIGSDLVQLSTGVDFVEAVIHVALGEEPDLTPKQKGKIAGIRFIFSEKDIRIMKSIEEKSPGIIIRKEISPLDHEIVDSSTRAGYYLMCCDSYEELQYWMKA